ncbi:MAG TPA: DUF2946 family protein [Rhizomicrobium sp.]|nr:DUF2946 family protein [Rhizomicrobium sp.]
MPSNQTPQSFGGWRSAFVFLIALAFGLQSYITQTHIHITSGDAQALGFNSTHQPEWSGTSSQSGDRDNHPDKDDPAHCPFCQAVAASGAAVVPVIPIVPQPISLPAFEPQVRNTILHAGTPRHNWLSRAPPSLQQA